MSAREDHYTNTVEDAAAWERNRGMSEHIDDRPTLAELDETTSAPTAVEILEKVRAFHASWGDTEDTELDDQALWEDLGRILGVTA